MVYNYKYGLGITTLGLQVAIHRSDLTMPTTYLSGSMPGLRPQDSWAGATSQSFQKSFIKEYTLDHN